MSYQVLARKWRPQDFSSLVGQEHLVTALRNALVEGRIAQAYLFSGIRGVGKTTAARVLAKALNCERGPAADPCNECGTCLEIASGASLDVLEVDAATYSKVEQIRELTETLRYGPARSRYKVVVLDEVHRLSRQAFDALLKIVEEPPPHLVFIFATTEIDAVPATILSRCQEFQFKRVPSPILAEHLRTIAEAEKIQVGDAALRLIARAGEGSVRDSVALLDQMATFGGGAIEDSEAQQLLGGLDSAIFLRLLQALVGGASHEVVAVVREIERNGWDPQNVFGQFLGYLRDALHLALDGGRPDSSVDVDLPDEEAKALADVARPIGPEAILQILQLLLGSEPTVRRSELGLLALEIAWLRAAELPKIQSIQRLLESGSFEPSGGGSSGGGSSGGGSSGGRSRPGGEGPGRGGSAGGGSAAGNPSASSSAREAARAPVDAPTVDATTVDATVDEAADEAADETASESPSSASVQAANDDPSPAGTSISADDGVSEDGGVCADGGAERLPILFEILTSRRQHLAAKLRDARIELREGTLHLAPRDLMLAKALERRSNLQAFEAAVRQVWGEGVRWRLEQPAPAGTADERPRDRSPNGASPPAARRPSARRAARTNEPASRDAPPSRSSRRSSRAQNGSASAFDPSLVDELPTVRAVLQHFGGMIQSISEEEAAR